MADEIRLIANGNNTTDPQGNIVARDIGGGSQFGVRFRVTPVITVSRVAQYAEAGLPDDAAVVVYTVTEPRKFSINAKFVSRTLEEADRTFREVNTLQSWAIPEGVTNNQLKPAILKLWGYKKQFDGIPMVLTNISITWPDDVDYIDGTNALVPIHQSVSLTLTESHNDLESRNFNIESFRQGLMPGY